MRFLLAEQNYFLVLMSLTEYSHLFPFLLLADSLVISVLLDELGHDSQQCVVERPITSLRSLPTLCSVLWHCSVIALFHSV